MPRAWAAQVRAGAGMALFVSFAMLGPGVTAPASAATHLAGPRLTAAPDWRAGLVQHASARPRLPRTVCPTPGPNTGCPAASARIPSATPQAGQPLPRPPAAAALSRAAAASPDAGTGPLAASGPIVSPSVVANDYALYGASPVVDSDGNIWFSNLDTIVKVTPAGVETVYQAMDAYGDTPTGSIGSMVFSQGDLWFLAAGAIGTETFVVGEMTPAGVPTFWEVAGTGSNVTSIAPSGGGLWIANGADVFLATTSGSSFKVTDYPLQTELCDCTTNQYGAFQLAAVGGTVWAAVDENTTDMEGNTTTTGYLVELGSWAGHSAGDMVFGIADEQFASDTYVDDQEWTGGIVGLDGTLYFTDGIDTELGSFGIGAGVTTGRTRVTAVREPGSPATSYAFTGLEAGSGASPDLYVSAVTGPLNQQQGYPAHDAIDRLSTSGTVLASDVDPPEWDPGMVLGTDGNFWLGPGSGSSESTAASAIETIDGAGTGSISLTPVAPAFLAGDYGGTVVASDGNVYSQMTGGLAGSNEFFSIVKTTPDFVTTIYSDLIEVVTPVNFGGNIIQGSDGNLWSVGTGDDVVEFDPTTDAFTRYDIEALTGDFLDNENTQLVSGPDGAIWFPLFGSYVARLTTSGTVTTYLLPGSAHDDCLTDGGAAVGLDGDIWIDASCTISPSTKALASMLQISTAGHVLKTVHSSETFTPGPMAAGPLGEVWAVGAGQSHGLIAATTGGSVTTFDSKAGDCEDAVAGPDGNLWCSSLDGDIEQINPAGGVVTLPEGGDGLGFDAAGNLWTLGSVTVPDWDSSATTLSAIERINLGGGGPQPAEEAGEPSGVIAPISCFAGAPVDCATGEFWHQFNDLTIPGLGSGLDFGHSYSSTNAGTSGPLGFGWSDAYTASALTADDGSVTVTIPTGASFVFTLASGGGYAAPAGVMAGLAATAGDTLTFTERDDTAYVFDSLGQLSQIVDPHGYVTSLAYSGGQLSTVTDPGGRTLSFVYSGSLLSTVTDQAGRVVQFSHDGDGNLSTVTEPDGGVWSFTYDPSHLLLTMTNPLGGVTTNGYDSSARVSSQTDPAGNTTAWSYGTDVTTVTDPTGLVTVDRYYQGMLVSDTLASGTPDAQTWSYSHDPATLQITATFEPDGHATQASYDADGDELTSIDAAGRVTTYTYNSRGEITSETDPAGHRTTETYGSHGDELSMTQAASSGHPLKTTMTYVAGSPGEMASLTKPDGGVWRYGYDSKGDMISATNPDGDVTSYAYNTVGEQTAVTDARGHSAHLTYDRAGRVLTRKDPLGHVTASTYDLMGDVTSSTDPSGNVTTYTYSADQQPQSATLPSGAKLHRSYDADGNLVSITDGAGHTWNASYNDLNQRASETDPLGHVTTFSYDPSGQMASTTSPSKVTTTFHHLASGWVSKATVAGHKSADVTYSYDADGLPTKIVDDSGTTTDRYNDLGQITAQTNGAKLAVKYAYDGDGNLTALTYPGKHRVSYTYDRADRMTAMSDWLSHKVTFGYDGDGDLVRERLGKLAVRDSYDAADALTAIKGGSRFAIDYDRNTDGLVSKEKQSHLPGAATTTYAYTDSQQLARSGSTAYTYDPAGNLTKVGKTTLAYNNDDEITKDASVGYGYDADGELRSVGSGKSKTTFGYDPRGRLVASTGVKRAVDAAGQVVIEKHGKATTKFAWNVAGQTPKVLAAGSADVLYGPGGVPVEQIDGKTADYLATDGLGSVRAMASTRGDLTGALSYAPFGAVSGHSGKPATVVGFAGGVNDHGLLDLDARDLDPVTGAFVTVDPALDASGQPYAYASDDPVNKVDPTGLDDGSDPLPSLSDSYCDYVGDVSADDDAGGLGATVLSVTCKTLTLKENVSGPGGIVNSLKQSAVSYAQNLPSTLRDDALSQAADYLGPEDAVPGLDVAQAAIALWNIEEDVGNAYFGQIAYELAATPPPPPPLPPPPIVTCLY